MLTTALGRSLWTRFAQAPVNWLNSAEGQNLMEKALDHLRRVEGEEERDALYNLLSSAVCYPDAQEGEETLPFDGLNNPGNAGGFHRAGETPG